MDCLPRKVSVVAFITGALRAKRRERGLWCEARDDRELRAEKRRKKYKAPVGRPIKETLLQVSDVHLLVFRLGKET